MIKAIPAFRELLISTTKEMRTKIYILLILTLLSFSVSAQESLRGIIYEQEKNEPLPYASIAIKSEDGNLISGVVAEKDGTFELEIPSGTYNVEGSYIGYETQKIRIASPFSEMLTISLSQNTKALDEVVVQGERTTVDQMMDRKVINIGADLQAAGGTAANILFQLPEIQMQQEGQISLRGSANVQILINGKPSPLSTEDILNQYSANDIKTIEIITAPSAKQRANGLTGIINIVTTEKGIKGFRLSADASANTIGGSNTSISTSAGFERVNISLGGGYNRVRNDVDYLGGRSSEEVFPYDVDDFRDLASNISKLNGAIDWYPGKGHEFTFSGNYTQNNDDNFTSQLVTDPIDTFPFDVFGDRRGEQLTLGGNYRWKFSEADFIEVDFQRTIQDNDDSNRYNTGTEVPVNSVSVEAEFIDFAVDISKSFKSITLESGFLYSRQILDNQRTGNLEDENDFTSFDREVLTLAGYVQARREWEKLKIQAGLRYEDYDADLLLSSVTEDLDQRFNNLFPSASFSYSFNENNQLQLAYSRRVSRPSVRQSNPLVLQNSPYFFFTGDPEIEPEFSNNVEATYQRNREKTSLSITGFYRYRESYVNYLYGEVVDRVASLRAINIGNAYGLGVESSFRYDLLKWYSGSINFNYLSERALSDFPEQLRRQGSGFVLSTQQSFKPLKKLTLDLRYSYEGNQKRFTYNRNAVHRVNLAARYVAFGNSTTFSIRFNDVFNSWKNYGDAFGPNFDAYWDWDPALFSQHAAFSVSYQILKKEGLKNRSKKRRRYSIEDIDSDG